MNNTSTAVIQAQKTSSTPCVRDLKLFKHTLWRDRAILNMNPQTASVHLIYAN